ncbi:MAG: HdeD family acid-resistance protein [Ktedonobacteraceae bacterium]
MKRALTRFGQGTLLRIVVAILFARGLIAVLFGVAAFFWQGLDVGTLATLFAYFVLVDGLLAALLAFGDFAQRVHWWGHLGEGVLGVFMGFLTLSRTNITTLGLLYLIVIWALVFGVLEIAVSFWTRTINRESWFTFVNGVFALLFGLVLLIQPGGGAITSVRLIVYYALVLGSMQVMRGARIYLARNIAIAAIV